jgi:hypothetical protein
MYSNVLIIYIQCSYFVLTSEFNNIENVHLIMCICMPPLTAFW